MDNAEHPFWQLAPQSLKPVAHSFIKDLFLSFDPIDAAASAAPSWPRLAGAPAFSPLEAFRRPAGLLVGQLL